MSAWSYIWMAALFKIPAIAFVWLIWRALRSEKDAGPQPLSDDGGSKLRQSPHPRPRVPRPPRRGPHGAAPIPSPARVRGVTVRARARAG
jgi:hypothetical protein